MVGGIRQAPGGTSASYNIFTGEEHVQQPQRQQQRANSGESFDWGQTSSSVIGNKNSNPAPQQQPPQAVPQQQQQVQGGAFGLRPDGRTVSSSAWASNASQNTGNIITDRSSTRIAAPPGGHSSLNIFSMGGDEPQQQQQGGRARNNTSSNAYAGQGGSQNTGNVITDRSSTRIAAPPGGAQTFSVFSNDGEPDSRFQQSGGRARVGGTTSSNAYANGNSQNTGNVLTDRSSTRIAAPPGGHTSLNIFSMGGDEPQQQQQQRGRGSAQEPENRFANAQPEPSSQPSKGTSSNVFAGSSGSQNVGNVITDRPSSRVLAPPGGKNAMGSSFAW